MRVYRLDGGTGRDRGRAHGEEFRGEITSLAALRTHLTRTIGGFAGDGEVRSCAEQHLPVLERFDHDLFEELLGIAEGANVRPADIVTLNHYTDLRDLGPKARGEGDGCSIACADTSSGLVLGQTWDMHSSAMPFVLMLRVTPHRGAPGAWVLSLGGCLGMAGVNDEGVAVLINNLTSTDAQVGLIWPALVRRVLQERTAEAAARVVEAAPVGSGHHYLVADSAGAIGIETSGTERVRTYAGRQPYVHTNHCVDPRVAAKSRIPEASTTHERYRWLEGSLAERPVDSAADLWRRLGSVEGYPRSVSTLTATATAPHKPATCAAIAIDFAAGELRGCAGLSHCNPGVVFSFGDDT